MRSATAAFVAVSLAAAAACLAPGTAAAREPRPADEESLPDGAEGLGDAVRALRDGDHERARAIATSLDLDAVVNDDYVHYVAGQSSYLTGRYRDALARFRPLARDDGSRFRARARWRVADCLWQLGRWDEARERYERLIRRHDREGDDGAARFRIAEAHARAGRTAAAIESFRTVRLEYPEHPLEAAAGRRLAELGGDEAATLSPEDRLRRTRELDETHLWHRAHREVWSIGDTGDPDTDARRAYWTAMTLYHMRRQYARAGEILLDIYEDLDERSARALFHGARALSRADQDERATEWYLRVVEEYPRSRWAPQAQFLGGWLQYNLGDYREALPLLREVKGRYPRSRWVKNTNWYLGFCHFLLGEYDEALPFFAGIARRDDRLWGGKGHYWKARTLQLLGRTADAEGAYRALVGRYPLSWYALLAIARLGEQDADVDPFGGAPRPSGDVAEIAATPDERLARAPLIRRADELIEAGLGVEAGVELRRGERRFIRRHDRSRALAMLLDRYRESGNYHRPWVLAVVYGGRDALDRPPKGGARVWWEHAYPRAYRTLVGKWRHVGKVPEYYLYAIMRKESGFNPHVRSYADARGLLQMIPPTTRKVARELGVRYTDDLLYDPEANIRTGAWYIGGVLAKFRGQIPFGAGSFNAGPAPIMEWMDENGDHPTDEFVELVSYSQTREYMKKVTETYARYLYLYEGEVYELPLAVDPRYVDNDLTY